MQGRLIRESNPIPGEKPGFMPQHLNENGNPVETGKVNPLPVTVTNQPTGVQDVNITNPADPVVFPATQNVQVMNQKEVQTVKDVDVNTRLLAIEQSNAAILTKLNGVIDTQVTGSNVEQLIVSASGNGSILPGQRESIIIRPEAGYTYEIMSISFIVDSPAGATTGTHRIYLRPANHNVGYPRLLDATFSYGNTIRYDGEFHTQEPQTVIPSSKENQMEAVKGFLLSSQGIELRYENNTNTENTGLRRIIMASKKTKVVI